MQLNLYLSLFALKALVGEETNDAFVVFIYKDLLTLTRRYKAITVTYDL